MPGITDFDCWTKQLKRAEQELDAAQTRTALDAAAKKPMRGRFVMTCSLSSISKPDCSRCSRTLGGHLTGIVRRVLPDQPAQQIAAKGHREADREGELIAERTVVHRYRAVLVLFRGPARSPGAAGPGAILSYRRPPRQCLELLSDNQSKIVVSS
jgi:hypothetical protein